jgi:spermidine/putrescine transport system ATP-binding protein
VIRPERIRVEAHGYAGANRIPALVERVVYLGAATQVHLRLATGESLQAEMANEGADSAALTQGTPVHAYLPADALRVLGGSPAAAPAPAEEPLAS